MSDIEIKKVSYIADPLVNVIGDIEIEGDVLISNHGVYSESVNDRLSRIESILGISPRDKKLEEEYPDLQEIGQKMDEALAEINHSYNTMISSIVSSYDSFAEECKVMKKLKSNNGNVE